MSATAPVELDSVCNFDDPAGTEAKLKELLPGARARGDRAYLVELLTQLGRAQGLQERFAEAHATLDEAEAILAKAGKDELRRARVRYLLERGRATNGIPGASDAGVAERKALSKPFFVEAFELATAAGEDALALDAAHMIGIVADLDEGIAWSERAIAVAEASKDPRARGWLGPLYNNLGWTYHDKGDFGKALELFEKGVAFRAEKKDTKPGPYRIARWAVARCHRSLGRLDEALAAQRGLLAELEAAGEKEGYYVYEELGECLLALGRKDEATPWFARAYEELAKDDWYVKNEAPRLARLRELGGLGAGSGGDRP